LSSVLMGGIAVEWSDQHFGKAGNLLLPGRGVDMGDGWETKRSRGKEHTDWVVVKLGARGKVHRVVIDTAHFRGNFPQGIIVDGKDGDGEWTEVLPVQKVGPDKEYEFGKGTLKEGTFTHIRMTIIPDGGVKRLRVFGTKA